MSTNWWLLLERQRILQSLSNQAHSLMSIHLWLYNHVSYVCFWFFSENRSYYFPNVKSSVIMFIGSGSMRTECVSKFSYLRWQRKKRFECRVRAESKAQNTMAFMYVSSLILLVVSSLQDLKSTKPVFRLSTKTFSENIVNFQPIWSCRQKTDLYDRVICLMKCLYSFVEL